MLDVSNEVKNQFLTDSTHKNLKFTTNPDWLYPEDIEYQKDMDTLNLFFGNAYVNGGWTWGYTSANPFKDTDWFHFRINRYDDGDSYDATGYVKTFAFKHRKYVNVSAVLQITSTSQTYPSQFDFCVTYRDITGTEREARVPFNLDDYATANTMSMTLETMHLSATGVADIERIWLSSISGNVNFEGTITVNKVMVNASDTISAMPIPYVYNDYSTINLNEYIPFTLFDNDNIVYEDFSLTESLCSKDNIKFGLCEAGNIEVNTCGIQNNNLIGEALFPYYETPSTDPEHVSYSSLKRINWYTGGGYSPQTGYSVTWRSTANLASEYTSSTSHMTLEGYLDYTEKTSKMYVSFDCKMSDFNGTDSPSYVRPGVSFVDEDGGNWGKSITRVDINEFSDFHHITIIFNARANNKRIVKAKSLNFLFLDENGNQYTNDGTHKMGVKVAFRNLQFGVLNSDIETIPSFSMDNCFVYNGTIDSYLEEHTKGYLPLGKMTVKDITKKTSHGLVTKKLSLYDDMVLLEQNAANWYPYMYGVDTSSASAYGLEYARQVYSSYFNYMQSIGIENIDNYDLTSIYSKTYDECVADYMSNVYTHFIAYRSTPDATPYGYKNIRYSVHTITADPTQLYVVKKVNNNYERDGQILSIVTYWTQSSPLFEYDSLGRGLISCNILIEETLSNGSVNKFVVNYNDLFAISNDCVSFKVYIPTYVEYNQSGAISEHTNIIKDFTIYKTPKTFTLANADSRLLYYNYLTKEIFECDSTITGRDVVHSILELTGCFFRMSREEGKPQFVYCVKSGLYPAENLYPADDLYPRMGTSETVPKNKYLSVEYADYEVTRFGKIQILKKQTSNETDSNVQWQYVGDNDAGLNTYIIDDNIFYCNKDMVYDTEHMTELDDTLAIMYNNISNMNYTPNVTQAIGLPWVECGDRMGLLTTDGGFETFIYRRKLKGIQSLFDTYESKGDEYNNAIKNYGY